MAVLDRNELEQSPLADLHAIASELGIEGYRRLRRDDLIEALLSGEAPASSDDKPARARKTSTRSAPAASKDDSGDEGGRSRSRGGRGRGGGRGRSRRDEDDGGESNGSRGGGRGRGSERSERSERSRPAASREEQRDPEPEEEDGPEVERSGVLDILPNGSGFMRTRLFHHSDDDVYVSPAQIRRCELRSGDELTGPVRPARRSERHPSLVRVDKVNDGEPEPPVERPSFDDLTPVFARQKLPAPDGLESAPFGRGSRVAVGGPPGAGVTSLLRDAVDKLRAVDDLDLVVVLAGVRPEEVTEWSQIEGLSVAGGGFDRPVDEQAQIADLAVERAKRIVERGGHAGIVIDTLDALPPGAARRVFGAARCIDGGGSLTVVASTGLAGEPQRVATTRIVLEGGSGDRKVAAGSGTLRAELLS
jgi:transcription termination factor Rho